MPALVGPIVGFALGVLLSWLCRGEAAREDDGAGRARLRIAAIFAALVYAPACAYFVTFAGDWALFYLVDSRAVPSAILLVLVVLDAASVAGGFWAGYQAARRRADRTLLALGAGPAAAAAAISLSFLSRLRIDGSFHQVSARFGTRPVAGGPLGYALLWMGAMLVAGLVVAGRALAEKSRTLPGAAPPERSLRSSGGVSGGVAPLPPGAPLPGSGAPRLATAADETGSPFTGGEAPPGAAPRRALLGQKRRR